MSVIVISTMKNADKLASKRFTDTKTAQNLYLQTLKTNAKNEKLFDLLSANQRETLENYLKSGSISIGNCGNQIEVAVWMKTDKNFAKAVGICRKVLDQIELMELEAVSSVRAKEDKSVVERIFRLKSLNRERYADRGRVNSNGIDIQINFGSGVVPYAKDANAVSVVSTDTKRRSSKVLNSVVSDV